MNKNPSQKSEIARRCLNHLNDEVELLQAYIRTSQLIHENLGLSPQAFREGKDPIEQLGRRSEQMDQERSQLTEALAGFLEVPRQQATIRRLLDVLEGDDAARINKKREELLELESLIQQQNRTNSFLIRQTIDLYQRIAFELSDQQSHPPTYSATGELTGDTTTNFLQADC